MKKENLASLSDFIDKEFGKRGTKKRDKFESGYEAFSRQVTSKALDNIKLTSVLK
jgi:hypothetical protein